MFRNFDIKQWAAWITPLTLLLLSVGVINHSFTHKTVLRSIANLQYPSITASTVHISNSISINDVSDVFDKHTARVPNKHLSSLLRCPHRHNNKTNAVRLPYQIMNISLIPPNSPQVPTSRFFNPTIIPLPPYSPHPYLLLSRVVTAGLHQESYICLATSCVPRNLTNRPRSLPADAHFCSESDIKVLGHSGGINCATSPQRLNIPPTPALRCEGAWSAFPDIPGFHDPRVFWSGKGEPLVIVNSASQYACVGLWVVDLRVVYPEIKELLGREGTYARLNVREESLHTGVSSRMSYPHLTELTRNPRKSRSAVEKNWILFFPRADEAWVQYDLVGHTQHKLEEASDRDSNASSDFVHAVDTDAGAGKMSNISNATSRPKYENTTSVALNHELIPQVNVSTVEPESASIRTVWVGELEHEHVRRSERPVNQRRPSLVPSRSFAKIIGSGYTTPNLTSMNESPCLASTNLLDSLENKGHWHQGSNSLRLILCSRQDAACLANNDEDELVSDGRVLHFAILHRKFSNDLDLPMRYERYLMVWEARFPFRMVGISQHPILFAGERARPWDDNENELEGDIDEDRLAGVYFTYTPSLAWSWRKQTMKDDTDNVITKLGTGYLGDDVIVGIGMDDTGQGFVRAKVDELLSCLRLCPDFVQQR